jgi:hypothetical protein
MAHCVDSSGYHGYDLEDDDDMRVLVLKEWQKRCPTGSSGARLMSATRAYTYRQKMQRSFAAELLSPFEAVEEMLAGDYSAENQQDAAQHFQVSDLTIRTLLVNHGRLERENLDEELEALAA